MAITIVCPINAYGPRQLAGAVISTIITQLIAGKEEIEVGSLILTKDFNYIKDTADGFIEIIKSNNAIGKKLTLLLSNKFLSINL